MQMGSRYDINPNLIFYIVVLSVLSAKLLQCIVPSILRKFEHGKCLSQYLNVLWHEGEMIFQTQASNSKSSLSWTALIHNVGIWSKVTSTLTRRCKNV